MNNIKEIKIIYKNKSWRCTIDDITLNVLWDDEYNFLQNLIYLSDEEKKEVEENIISYTKNYSLKYVNLN